MRNFLYGPIMKRIEQAPEHFIVQRDIHLLSAFLYGYQDILLEIDNYSTLCELYLDTPSLEDFARQKYQVSEIRARNFTSLLAWYSEDSRDLFYRYIAFIKEYEATFPVNRDICWVLREKPALPLKILLAGIRRRYPMYFGHNDLSHLRAFLDGYFLCKTEYCLPLDDFEEKVLAFTHSIECEIVSASGLFSTWDRKFRYDREWQPWGDCDGNTATHILAAFWSELEKFTGSLTDS